MTKRRKKSVAAPALWVTVDRSMEKRWHGSSAEATELAINLFVLTARVTAFSEALCAKYGVPSPAAFNVLTILHGTNAPVLPSEIARRMIVTRPTMTGIVASLAKRHLVRTLRHPTDGRKAPIALTEAGRRIVEGMRPELHTAEKRWMLNLTPTERRSFARILATLQATAPAVAAASSTP